VAPLYGGAHLRKARVAWPNLPMRLAITALAFTVSGAAAPAAEVAYEVDAARSSVVIHVGRSGVFSFAGHTHTVAAPGVRGRVVAVDGDLARSSVRLTFESGRLTVLERGEPAGDAPKVQAAMLGPKVLDAARYPEITFESTAVAGTQAAAGSFQLTVRGSLTLHGVTRAVALPLAVDLGAGELKATGRMTIRQTDYGIDPVSVAGVVKVKNELAVEYTIVATPARP
jgi:polyisoprenoid-binding protein YceI